MKRIRKESAWLYGSIEPQKESSLRLYGSIEPQKESSLRLYGSIEPQKESFLEPQKESSVRLHRATEGILFTALRLHRATEGVLSRSTEGILFIRLYGSMAGNARVGSVGAFWWICCPGPSCAKRSCGLMDKASAHGAGDCRLESHKKDSFSGSMEP